MNDEQISKVVSFAKARQKKLKRQSQSHIRLVDNAIQFKPDMGDLVTAERLWIERLDRLKEVVEKNTGADE
jgi:hypothetical protein